MNLRALAAADPDTPMRQRNCGAVPVGDSVEIRIKDGTAYYMRVRDLQERVAVPGLLSQDPPPPRRRTPRNSTPGPSKWPLHHPRDDH